MVRCANQSYIVRFAHGPLAVKNRGKGKRGKGKGEVAATKFDSGLFYKAYSSQKCRKGLYAGGGST